MRAKRERGVTGVSNVRSRAHLALRLHSDHVAALHHDLVHGLVQHVGAAVDGAQSKNDA